jgi:hypothetical protein
MKQLFSIVLLLCSVVACGGAGSKDNSSISSPAPGAGGTSDGATSITLQPGVAILMDASEPAPVQRAVQDLQRDLKKIFGVDSPVVNTASAIEGVPAVVVTFQGRETAAYRTTALAGAESHSVSTAGSAAVPRIVLQGADTRGAVYAIYTFSERIIGIPPLWYWASIEPQPQRAITVASNFALVIPSPAVPWRVAFPNDEAFLSPWTSAKQQNFDAFFETLLCLKFNTIDVDSMRDFPAPNQGLLRARAARDRGLAVTFTHLAPFGANPADWNNFWTLVKKVAVPPAFFPIRLRSIRFGPTTSTWCSEKICLK